MTIDVLTVPSPQLEPKVIKEEEVTPDEVTAGELESEDSTLEAAEVENQEGWEDPLRLYLHEIEVFHYSPPAMRRQLPVKLRSAIGWIWLRKDCRKMGSVLLPVRPILRSLRVGEITGNNA